ncbi:MAG: hypothetical protein JW982_13075 [Spirochaetes bacterium]|nr:hypothetical protein [Spirochaetota bacterium]
MAAASVKKTTKNAKSKRKTNLLKLYSAMNKLILDAVDKEIVKRCKILIDTAEEDITKTLLDKILKNNDALDMSLVDEAFVPYVKHYIFMLKRGKRA